MPVSGTPAEIRAYAAGETPLPPNEPTAKGPTAKGPTAKGPTAKEHTAKEHTAPRRWPTDPYPDQAARYGVLRKLLAAADGEAGRKEVVDTLKAAGLRGMGGAGFPTGMKWDFTARAQGDPKYVVCNADESEPGTFKDRMILEELPHLMIEAMVLGGWVTGANEGIVYLRHEYGREKKALQAALEAARQAGAIGPSVLGSGFAFDLRIFVSPGGYILGEETAMLEALEDKRGEPRNKPPFPTNHGLWGKPTLINNVETFAAIPVILHKGAEWWNAQGKGDFQGLKYLSVSGDVADPGVYCVPMGTTIAELLDICGGVPGGKALGAFAPGGASSNFLPANKADVPLDFQALQEAGSMLGSGAVIFAGEDRDLLELALNVTRFFRNESCGKCVPCRVGSHKAVALVEAALNETGPNETALHETALHETALHETAPEGTPQPGLVGLLSELNHTLARTSICGLGQVALGPLMSVIENFPAAAKRLENTAAKRHDSNGGTAQKGSGPCAQKTTQTTTR